MLVGIYIFAKTLFNIYNFQTFSKKIMLRTQKSYIEYANTDCDSSQEKDYEVLICKTNPLKHKTQLCKTYSELGYCNYGQKCRFAHGRHQLITIPKNQQLSKRKCNGFWGKCHCNYGIRCQFGHGQEKQHENLLILQVAKASFGVDSPSINTGYGSKLLRIQSNN